MSKPANPVTLPLADYSPKHFLLAVVDRVATVTLNRPERTTPLTCASSPISSAPARWMTK